MTTNPPTILLVEDSEGDAEIACIAFEEAGFNCNIEISYSGEEALSYLNEANLGQLPTLVFLDLNMPGIDGFEVLESIKSSDRLRHIPVIILTTSNSHRDIERCFNSHANAYILKSSDVKAFIHNMKKVKEFWFQINTAHKPSLI